MLGAVLLATHVGGDPMRSVTLIALVAGAFQVACGVLGVGGLTKYISRTVIIAYTAATGLLILLNQIPNFIGVEVSGVRGLFARVWRSLALLPEAEGASVFVGAVTLAAIAGSRRLAPRIPSGFLGMVVGSLAAWGLRVYDPSLRVKLVADVQPMDGALPRIALPGLDGAAVYELAGPASALGLLACIEVSTISKNLAMRTGQPQQANQDIFALGLGNLAAAFFGAMPGSGSFTRSEFGLRSGAKTRWGVVASALMALAIVLAAGRWLEQVPLPALAALVMWLSVRLVETRHLRVALLATYSDALVFLSTFLAAIFLRLDYAIYLGMLVSMALFLQQAAAPRLMEFQFDEAGQFKPVKNGGAGDPPQILMIHVEGQLFFGAAETLQQAIWDSVDRERTKVVVLRLRNAQNLDATGVMVLDQLIHDLRALRIHVLISGTSPEIDWVAARSGLDRTIGAENYFPSAGNFLEATRQAVIRAKQLVGVANPQVRLLYDTDKQGAAAAKASGESSPGLGQGPAR
jgi:SulP family sulfate permease